jgi:3-oxoacyl-[acyl-carrier protein] reductase
MVKSILRQLGPVDILVNHPGIAILKPFDQMTEEDGDRIMAVNLKSAFLVTEAVLPGMRSRRFARIVNLSSGAAQTGGVVDPHYAASKAGLLSLTHGAIVPDRTWNLQGPRVLSAGIDFPCSNKLAISPPNRKMAEV